MKRPLFEDNTDWVVDERLAKHRGRLRNRYFYKGRLCYRLVLKSQLSKQLGGYILIERDIRNVLTWLGILTEKFEQAHGENYNAKSPQPRTGDKRSADEMKALTVAIVSFYGKLFTTAKGRRVSLNAKIITDKENLKTHEEMMKMRHSFAAHSGTEGLESVSVVLVLDSNENRFTNPEVLTELSQLNSKMTGALSEQQSLLSFLHEFVKSKISLLRQKVGEEAISDGYEAVYDRVRKPKKRRA